MLTRQCTEVVDHHAPACISSSPYHFAEPEALSCHDLVRLQSHQDNCTETSEYRGDNPSKRAKGHLQSGIDDSAHLNESTIGSQGYYTGSTADYSSYSYKSRIATFSSGISEPFRKPIMTRGKFKGEEDEPDKHFLESPNAVIHRDQNAHDVGPSQLKHHLQAAKLKHDSLKIKPDKKNEKKVADCYRKSTYTVLIGDTVKVYDTKTYAILPLRNHYLVKERIKDASGNTRVKMSLRTFHNRFVKVYGMLVKYLYGYLQSNAGIKVEPLYNGYFGAWYFDHFLLQHKDFPLSEVKNVLVTPKFCLCALNLEGLLREFPLYKVEAIGAKVVF